MLTHEQKLDELLKSLPNWDKLKDDELDKIYKAIYHNDVNHELLQTLLEDKYVTIYNLFRPVVRGQVHAITERGKRFLKEGGYTERKRKEDDFYISTVKGFKVNKRTFKWTKAATILAGIGTAILIYQFLQALCAG